MGTVNLGQVAAFIDSVEVEKLPADAEPAVRNDGTRQNAKFVFGIPALSQEDIAKIDAEKTRAETAESDLQTAIDAEKTRAKSAEDTLQTKIENAQTQAAATTVFDTRNENKSPAWYFQNYPRRVVWEFKLQTVIGFSTTGGFCNLQTQVGWSDASGGNVVQVAYANTVCKCRSGSGDSWGAWRTVYSL